MEQLGLPLPMVSVGWPDTSAPPNVSVGRKQVHDADLRKKTIEMPCHRSEAATVSVVTYVCVCVGVWHVPTVLRCLPVYGQMCYIHVPLPP